MRILNENELRSVSGGDKFGDAMTSTGQSMQQVGRDIGGIQGKSIEGWGMMIEEAGNAWNAGPGAGPGGVGAPGGGGGSSGPGGGGGGGGSPCYSCNDGGGADTPNGYAILGDFKEKVSEKKPT